MPRERRRFSRAFDVARTGLGRDAQQPIVAPPSAETTTIGPRQSALSG